MQGWPDSRSSRLKADDSSVWPDRVGKPGELAMGGTDVRDDGGCAAGRGQGPESCWHVEVAHRRDCLERGTAQASTHTRREDRVEQLVESSGHRFRDGSGCGGEYIQQRLKRLPSERGSAWEGVCAGARISPEQVVAPGNGGSEKNNAPSSCSVRCKLARETVQTRAQTQRRRRPRARPPRPSSAAAPGVGMM